MLEHATCNIGGVALLLVETTGALGAAFMTILRILAKQTRLPGATDLTQYGEGRASTKARSRTAVNGWPPQPRWTTGALSPGTGRRTPQVPN